MAAAIRTARRVALFWCLTTLGDRDAHAIRAPRRSPDPR
jgi:hypothetical protein